MRTPIPKGAWMRLRQRGRYAYAINKNPITWQNKAPPPGTEVFTLAWHNAQHSLMASGSIIMPGEGGEVK